MKSKNIAAGLTVATILALSDCASNLPKVDLPAGSDPQARMTETDARLNADRGKQYDQLSPSHFKDAQNALLEAHQKSAKGETSEKVLAKVSESMAHLQLVEEFGQKGSEELATVLSARSAARSANAETTDADDFKSADKQLRSFGDDIEDRSFKPEAGKISKLEGRYSNLELQAIKSKHLGQARSLIDAAVKADAKKVTPETYTAAQVQYDSAERAIEANRHNPEIFAPSVALSVKSAQKLNQVIRTVKESKTSEAVAVQLFTQNQQLAEKQASLQSVEAQALASRAEADQKAKDLQSKDEVDQKNISALEGQNQRYAEREKLNQNIERIKSEFSPNEAEVVRDGNKIIIRLKSMQFSTARFDLTSTSLSTLQKVKEMIAAVPVTNVVVEGHTDSVGSAAKNKELSQKRADAVKNYFVAEKTVADTQIEAKGMGYEHPLTNNKTKEGRSTNRRVDVIIETTSTM